LGSGVAGGLDVPHIHYPQSDSCGDPGEELGVRSLVIKWILRILTLPWLVLGNWQGYAWRVGRARLKWDRCPLCNSDAPLIYDCPVCKGYEESWPPGEELKEVWSETFWRWLYRPEQWKRSKV